MIVPYGAEYPEYKDEDGDWMTAFPSDKTPYQIVQEVKERMRLHERRQAILSINRPTQFTTNSIFAVQTLTASGWNIVCEGDNYNSLIETYDEELLREANQQVRVISRYGNIVFTSEA